MAETTGLINLLTERVLRRSLAQAAAWRAQGIHLNVAVNLSPKNLLGGDVVGLVVRCLADAGVPGNVLTLELTESCLVGDIVSTAAILQGLRDQGVRIYIDDFRSEEHTSELQSLMRISYAVFCLKNKE